MAIDRSSRTPLYMQVYEELLKDIQQRKYGKGEMPPSEKDLGTTFDVDRQTVRHALALLSNEGIVEKRAGRGSFITDPSGSATPKDQVSGEGTIAFLLPEIPNSVDRITEPFNARLFHHVTSELRTMGYNLTYATVSSTRSLENISGSVSGAFFVSAIDGAYFVKAEELGLPVVALNNYSPRHVSVVEDSYAGGYQAMNRMLGKPGGTPEALFAANDMMAYGAIEAIHNAGMKVPDDIRVIGFDDIDQCGFMNPKLTTVRVDAHEMAREACHLMMRKVRGEDIGVFKVIIPVRLVERESAGRG